MNNEKQLVFLCVQPARGHGVVWMGSVVNWLGAHWLASLGARSRKRTHRSWAASLRLPSNWVSLGALVEVMRRVIILSLHLSSVTS